MFIVESIEFYRLVYNDTVNQFPSMEVILVKLNEALFSLFMLYKLQNFILLLKVHKINTK